MKNKRKQILLSSVVMLIVATMALTSTTYAWFSQSNAGQIDHFEFTAEDASGIQFSVDAKNWKSTLTATEIAAEVKATTETAASSQTGSLFGTVKKVENLDTFEGLEFSPVSTAGDTAGGVMNLYSASSENNAANTMKTEVAKEGYYKFNVYVKNMSENNKALLLTSATVAGYNNNKNTQLATRIAFLDQGNTTTTGEEKTTDSVANVAYTLKNATSAVIVEQNETAHTTDAINLYGAKQGEKSNYNGVNAEVSGLTTTNGFINAKDNDVKAVTTVQASGTTKVAELAGNSVTKMTIYVWIEGQDVDCNNDIASGDVQISMEFETKEKFSVTYDKNTQDAIDNVPTDSTFYLCGGTVNVITDALTRTGYTFLGWSTDKSATTATYTSDGTKTFTMGTSDVTLYAVWEVVTPS